ncbi:MAG TPA: DUF501 domain-containing protein [Acidimicrobiia bacterium]|nr:DUF501 domain-containing protein [Acidimicrobiia bacterium]
MPTSADALVHDEIAAQIGRPLRAESRVAGTCHLGLPVVIEVPPLLEDGTPFPTHYWLSCPLAIKRISRLESGGEVGRMEARRQTDPVFASDLASAHRRYAAQRDALLPADAHPRPRGGVAGAIAGIKCLHAHYADHAVGNENPVGSIVAPQIEPLDCTIPCVVAGALNPDWQEPR